MSSVLIKMGNTNTETHTGRMPRWRQIGVMHWVEESQRLLAHHQKLGERQGTDCPSQPSGGTNLPPPWSWPSSLWSCEAIHFCWVSPQPVAFVMVALADEYSYKKTDFCLSLPFSLMKPAMPWRGPCGKELQVASELRARSSPNSFWGTDSCQQPWGELGSKFSPNQQLSHHLLRDLQPEELAWILNLQKLKWQILF